MRNVPKQDLFKLSKQYQILILTSVGHIMELYDFIVYGVMLPFLAKAFLPTEDQSFSMFLMSLSFAITFLITPIGSIFWGWYGDKFGRISMLNISMIMMAIPSFTIALLPNYQTIGFVAPLFLILLRIIQGISASGEIMGAKIFAMELMGDKSHGISSGIITASGSIGVLLAILMGYLTTISSLDYFWRFPFVLGAILFVIASFIRKNLANQIRQYQPDQLSNDRKITAIFRIAKNKIHSSMIVFVLGAMLGILSYYIHVFVNPFLIKQGFLEKVVYQYAVWGSISTVFSSLLAGIYIDKYCNNDESFIKNLKYIVLMVTILFLPSFLLIIKGSYYTLIAYIMLGFLLGSYACISAIMMYKAFPKEVRCRGILFNYAFGCGVFGGLTPLVLNAICKINIYFPSVIVSISFIIIYIFLKINISKLQNS